MKTAILTAVEVIKELGALKAHLRASYGVSRIGLFGSTARDENGELSDLDIVVEMEPDLFKRVLLRSELESHFRRPVDVVRYRTGMNPRLKSRIDREALYV
jgi:predicted nucleotidyltransferase